jgi:membrane protein YdbS with pleckstrin-like domain
MSESYKKQIEELKKQGANNGNNGVCEEKNLKNMTTIIYILIAAAITFGVLAFFIPTYNTVFIVMSIITLSLDIIIWFIIKKCFK